MNSVAKCNYFNIFALIRLQFTTIILKTEKMKKILFVLTSHEDLGKTGHKTGFWLDEFAAPYYYLTENDVEVSIASPKGAQPPVDPNSQKEEFQTPSTKKFNADKAAQSKMANSLLLSSVNQADYDAVFFPGGLGPMWDLAEDKTSIALIESFYANDKLVSSVCHGGAAFKHVKKPDGTSMVSGIKVTGYSDSEEELIDVASFLPFYIEKMLRDNEGVYSKGGNWKPYAVEDGLLITGQNFASSELVAKCY